MAVKMYYGTCTTAKGVSEKAVIVRDAEVLANDFAFQTGDLLVVYMADSNTVEEPSIVVYGGDSQLENSISSDSGKLIKIKSIVADAVGAWDAGETVVFVYTKNPTNNDNVYYWELINGAHSTDEIYGVTKLFGNSSTDLDWMGETIEPEDYQLALTPGMLKKFYQALMSPSAEPEPGETPLVQLTWIPAAEGNLNPLGQLSLSSSPGSGITIEYPLIDIINAKIGEITIPRCTGNLVNTGETTPSGDLSDFTKSDGNFFLTNIVPTSIGDGGSTIFGLKYINPETSQEFGFLYPNGDGTSGNEGKLVLQGRNGVVINASSGIRLNGPVSTNGTINAGGRITSVGLTTTGSIDAKDQLIQTTGPLKGQTIYENNTSLRDRYQPKLWVRKMDTGLFTVSANASSGHRYLDLAHTNWTPIGIVGFNEDYSGANTGTDASRCHLWEAHVIGGPKLEYAVRNYMNKANKIRIYFYVLYQKNI